MRYVIFILFLASIISCTEHREARSHRNVRIDSLLSVMTLEEKVGQMIQLNITMINQSGVPTDHRLNEDKLRDLIRTYNVGSFLNGAATAPEKWFRYSHRLQEIALEESRLGIPIIYGIDHVHGAGFVEGATVFPQPINLAATFNPSFAADMAKVTVMESADLGHHWIFAPVLDLGINPLWPRLWETFGEDPLVASEMGHAYTEALQDPNHSTPFQVAACAKHFIGYSDPRSGWDRTPSHIPDQYLHEFLRPSFQRAIDAGVHTVMINSGEINGVPVHASPRILKGLLRSQMRFEGVVITDWKDIQKLVENHRIAENEKEATFLAIQAGIDISMAASSTSFCVYLRELVAEGRISETRIDESVKRILNLKQKLGLFEHPYPSKDRLRQIGAEANRLLAKKAAKESIVLLKNDSIGSAPLLPLDRSARLLLTGMSAHSKRNLAGGWTIQWQGAKEERYPEDMYTIKTALDQDFESVRYVPDPQELKRLSKRADVILIATGEEPYTEFEGNINDLSLAQEEIELIETAVATQVPVVLLLVEGRPRALNGLEKKLAGIIWAGLPGFEGAEAIASVVSGQVNPSGKLPLSYPAFSAHHTAYHHKPTETGTWMYPFGHGLSYTTFEYSKLSLSDTVFSESIQAKVQLENVGGTAGKETVLWFLKDEVGRITRPVKILKHFEKVHLNPGERKEVFFDLEMADLMYPNEKGVPVAEPGYFVLQVGDHQKRFRLPEWSK
ncbi:MAG: glycoside hydrolase family 3 N-terminal domain-containing protein [Bacteroidota bacterium]